LLAGYIGIFSLNVECQASEYVLLQDEDFQDEELQGNMSIYNLEEMFNNCRETLSLILEIREKIKFISWQMNREGLYIPYLNEIVDYLNIALAEQDALLNSPWKKSSKDEEAYKCMFLKQQVKLSKILYVLNLKLIELLKKNPVKFESAEKEFDENYYSDWLKKFKGIEIYKY